MSSDVTACIWYFIVIDDIWTINEWETISCAFMDSAHGSRILTTTRNLDVAQKTGAVYKLEPLSSDNSKELLYRGLYGGKGKCPNDHPDELTKKILHKCGGVPLAIITIASLLHGKPRDDWSQVYTSIGFESGENKEVDNTRKIILFSYYDLPCHLRTCLLHLSIFPEDYKIDKEVLIWKWVAEGIVRDEPTDNNFVIVLDNNEHHTSPQNKARRIAVQNGVLEQDNHLAKTQMPQVRSFYAIACRISVMPSLSSFEALRVLDIGGYARSMIFEGGHHHLEHIGKLLQLRYLGLSNIHISEVPEEIGYLRFLQTLYLESHWIEELPHSVGLLSQLKCLHAQSCYRHLTVPDWIGNLTSLEELRLDEVESPNFPEELRKLEQLRVLCIRFPDPEDVSRSRALLESIANLKKIQRLELICDCDSENRF
ncbi:disease resistance protein PIK6-NP-like [Triticum dicoccoides]|uniref:disease resistance protein PIK6-NP-like n=1 Tax=Triticum dicoccoides TaxID=85692 RepID=UPI00189125CC|nr:disease resistance protein PIK6-NP-like [Triticum dicoccoides]